MRVAIYAGSFDPVTNGHLDVIRRGSQLFDRLIVAVGDNPAKSYWFSAEERAQLVLASCQDLENVETHVFHGLLVDTAKELGAQVILRGLRALSDFELEFRNGLANRDLSGIETLFLLSSPENIFVSSSLVKEIVTYGGNVGSYVSSEVRAALDRVVQERQK